MPSKTAILKNLQRAKLEASKSTFFKQHVGCVLMVGNRVLALAHNSEKTYPIQQRYNKFRGFRHPERDNFGYIHAEMQILQKTQYLDLDWEDTTLYIGRVTRGGEQGLARPCPACERAIRKRGIGTVYYTLDKEGFDIL